MVESQHRAQVASNPPTLALGSLRRTVRSVLRQLLPNSLCGWPSRGRRRSGAPPSPLLPITPGCLSAATPMLRPSVGHNNKTETLPMSGGGTIDCSAVSDPLPFLPIAMRRSGLRASRCPPGPALRDRRSHGHVLGRRQVYVLGSLGTLGPTSRNHIGRSAWLGVPGPMPGGRTRFGR